jgi:hypothetical protein
MKIVKLIKTGYENNYIYLLLLLLSTVIYGQTGQSGGIGYQAVIYKSNIQTTPGVPIATTPLLMLFVCDLLLGVMVRTNTLKIVK